LPPSWLRAKAALRLKTPYNFVSTADTHGGNSGSPTVNAKGEIVGILFDGNLEGLPNQYVYRDTRERSVHVASQGIIEALSKVYRAASVLKELGF
jgi:V8-like Glu-specific endopeptidase